MRPFYVLARWMGLSLLLFLAAWLGTHLAHADEKAPQPAQTGQQTVENKKADNARKQTAKRVPDDTRESPTPPGFPYGPAGGSLSPAGAGNSGALNPLGFTTHP
jgi:hypothetical protein